jgi:uncharacterized protein (TIGR02147 family)
MSIYNFEEYRPFLKKYIKDLPRQGRGEINRWAVHLRVHSSFVSQVLSGAKDLNLEQSQELATFLGLNSLETDYFLLLVQKARAGTAKLRDYFIEKQKGLKLQSMDVAKNIRQDRALTDEEKSVLYSSWLYIAIWLYSSVKGVEVTLERICERFDISRARATKILNFLVDTGLCLKEKETFKMGHQLVHIDRESPHLVKHHMNWRAKSMQRSEDIQLEEIMFTAPISIGKEDFAFLRAQLVEFIKAAQARVQKTTVDEVACLNLDLFWVRK